MRRNELESVLVETAGAVLESMFFTTIHDSSDWPNETATPQISARLNFHGETSGSFGVRTPVETGRAITSNFLGIGAESITEAQIGEVVCELANMLCGSALSRLEGYSRFDLSHPELDPPGTLCPAEVTSSRLLQIDEGNLAVWLSIG